MNIEEQKQERTRFLIILSIAFAVRLIYLFIIPLYPSVELTTGYNDEPLHLHYVKHMAEEDSWPVWYNLPDSLNYLTDAYIHPPLYYKLASYSYRIAEWMKNGWGLYGARLTSLIFGLIGCMFVYRTARLSFDQSIIALSAFTVTALAPPVVIFSSIVTNDAMLFCVSSMAVHSLMRCRTEEHNPLRQIMTGLFIGTATWVKMSGLTLIPLAFLAAKPDTPVKEAWYSRLRVLIISVLFVLPLFNWNLAHYGQFVPGQQKPLATAYWPGEASALDEGGIYHPISAIKYSLRSAVIPFNKLWGSNTEKTVTVIWILSGLILFIAGVTASRKKTPHAWLFIANLALVTCGILWHNIKLYQVEFRLFTPAFVSLAILMSTGANRLRLPLTIQGIIWLIPILILPFL